jgi:hypothetical protein
VIVDEAAGVAVDRHAVFLAIADVIMLASARHIACGA